MNRMRYIGVAFFVFFLSAISLKWLPYPFPWIFGGTSLVSFLQFRKGRDSRAAVIWFNVGCVLFILASFEIALEATKPSLGVQYQLYDSLGDPVLGYVLKPNSERRAWRSINGTTLYDVTYTVDQDGLRISPPCLGACESSILFFGGSFTYGEGVNDEDTLPYQVGLRSLGRYEIYNFGVHGYGPNHMLALVESGKVTSTVHHPPDVAIYQALLPEHVYRVAGLRPWIRTSPRYVLDSGGNVALSGKFSDGDLNWPFWPLFRRNINKSALGQRVLNHVREVGPNDNDLFVAVVASAAQQLRHSYPGIGVHILIWGDPPVGVVSELEDANISVHFVDSILQASNITGDAAKIKGDGHPTPRAYAAVADHIVRTILKPEEKADR